MDWRGSRMDWRGSLMDLARFADGLAGFWLGSRMDCRAFGKVRGRIDKVLARFEEGLSSFWRGSLMDYPHYIKQP